jgi:hypothetical protein
MRAKEKYGKLSDDAGSTEKHFSSDYPYLLVLGLGLYFILLGLHALKAVLKALPEALRCAFYLVLWSKEK